MVRIRLPKDRLAYYVESIIYSEYNPSHSTERLIPDGSVNLILELGNEPQYVHDNTDLLKKKKYVGAWISGIQQGYIAISAKSVKGMCVIRFCPAGAYSVLHVPVDELKNLVIDAQLVLGQSIVDLRETLMAESSVYDKFRLIETWLNGRIRESTIPEKVVQYAVEQTHINASEADIKKIIERTGYSHRHFIQLFKKYVGISPKQYHRILRFNKVLEKIENRQMMDWPGISTQCGYYDQSHFIKEFKTFSGFNPQNFLTLKGEFINYVPLV